MKLELTQAPASNETELSTIKPVYGSDKAACFDLKADLKGRLIQYKDTTPSSWSANGVNGEILLGDDSHQSFRVDKGERVLIPTGFIFGIPEGFRMNIVSRSGLSWNSGIIVLNAPAVIDEDYVDETFVVVHNTSSEPFIIEHGMRIAQAEINPVYRVELDSLGERESGFGSSGLK